METSNSSFSTSRWKNLKEGDTVECESVTAKGKNLLISLVKGVCDRYVWQGVTESGDPVTVKVADSDEGRYRMAEEYERR